MFQTQIAKIFRSRDLNNDGMFEITVGEFHVRLINLRNLFGLNRPWILSRLRHSKFRRCCAVLPNYYSGSFSFPRHDVVVTRVVVTRAGRYPIRWPVRFPVVRVKVPGHAALNAYAVSPASVAERPAQIMLPAAKHALQQAFGRIVDRVTPRCMLPNPLLIDCVDALHF